MKIGKIILLLYTVLFFNKPIIYSQTSFDLLISRSWDEVFVSSAIDQYGNYYFSGRKSEVYQGQSYGYLLKINDQGEILREVEFFIPDSSIYLGDIFMREDTIIIFGTQASLSDIYYNEILVYTLDLNLNLLSSENRNFPSSHYLASENAIINHNDHFILSGNAFDLKDPNFFTDIYFYELNSNFDSINCVIDNRDYIQMEMEFMEDPLDHSYKVFGNGTYPNTIPEYSELVLFDSSFNYISVDSLPWHLTGQTIPRILDDTSYLLSGRKYISVSSNRDARADIGIVKLNYEDQILKSNLFGKSGDTNTYGGVRYNADYIEKNSIYYGGTSNIIPFELPWQTENSWIMLNNLDSNLNLNWQKFYGGDAFYHLRGLRATEDGGCLMYATRYDSNTQFEENDMYILKVDTNGLLTSVNGDGFSIPQGLIIYPNPAKDIITITSPWLNKSGNKEISIYNSLGKEVKRLSLSGMQESVQLNVSGIPPGLCFVTIFLEGKKMATGKMLIVR